MLLKSLLYTVTSHLVGIIGKNTLYLNRPIVFLYNGIHSYEFVSLAHKQILSQNLALHCSVVVYCFQNSRLFFKMQDSNFIYDRLINRAVESCLLHILWWQSWFGCTTRMADYDYGLYCLISYFRVEWEQLWWHSQIKFLMYLLSAIYFLNIIMVYCSSWRWKFKVIGLLISKQF